ncbi:MAG: potassium-transporting ATPase subunit KdpA [Firmicutes bacterium]|nr:potassium-transporting ATPase subunit KdpA [Bacillota bacterium]
MAGSMWFLLFIYLFTLLVLSIPLGLFMAKVFNREKTFLDFLLVPVENFCYRIFKIDARAEMRWTQYAFALLVFNLVGLVLLYLLQRIQQFLPFNPRHFGAVAPDLAFNTAVSFVTNTNWQAYSGESTMSYLVQMAGLAVQNFLSAATGIAVAIALVRGIVRKETKTIGNFWFDLTRSVLWILLPLSLLIAPLYIWQGVPQNIHAYTDVNTLEGAKQVIAQGPVASQEVIKELGTNGGGFFNANSSHPFENPTPLTNFIQILTIFLISAALCITFGKMSGDKRHGIVLLVSMILLFVTGFFFAYKFEKAGNPQFAALMQRGTVENMEGKEVRFGVLNSSLFAVVTTCTSCGAVNSMHDSFTPLGGLVPLFNIELGEVIFGGVGSGLYGILLYAILSVFIAGLMVGRTPEYLGKKIQSFEVKMVMLGVLISPACMLVLAAIGVVTAGGMAGISNPGPHGLTQVLYAFSSGAGNNGSAFAGLSANTLFYNILMGVDMLIGRFAMLIPVLAVAGSLAEKKKVPMSIGTFPTTGFLFVVLLIGVLLIVGALTFFPAISLGPILDHLQMLKGILY